MTASKLSMNQEQAMKTKSMEQTFKRSRATDFGSGISMSEGAISVPPLCEAMGLTGDACTNLKTTSQVSYIYIYFYVVVNFLSNNL